MLEGKIIFEGVQNEVDIVVRHVQRDDVERLLSFMNTLSNEQTYISLQGEQISLETESRYVEDFIKKAESHEAVKLLLLHKGELVGVGDIVLKDKIEKHIGIFGITLKKEWRKIGLGQFLMKKTLEEAQKNIIGLQIITLGVFANNTVARLIYEKMGFKEYGLLPKGIKYKGELIDHVYMYKQVS